MTTLGFSHYNLRASRQMLELLREFYCEVVGLTVGARPPFESFGYWLYAGGEAVLHLSEASLGLANSAGIGTFDHAAFNCTDRSAFERRLVHAGVTYRVAHVPQTTMVQLFFHDPAGNGVELNFTSD